MSKSYKVSSLSEIDEIELNHLDALGQTNVDSASSKRSSPAKPEVDTFDTFSAPAQVQGSILDAREEFINEARKVRTTHNPNLNNDGEAHIFRPCELDNAYKM